MKKAKDILTSNNVVRAVLGVAILLTLIAVALVLSRHIGGGRGRAAGGAVLF